MAEPNRFTKTHFKEYAMFRKALIALCLVAFTASVTFAQDPAAAAAAPADSKATVAADKT